MNRDEVIGEIKKLNLPFGQYIVVGGACLAAHRLGETKDLDIVVVRELFDHLQRQGWPLDPVYERKWNRLRLKKGNVEIYPDMLLEKEGKFVDIEELINDAEVIDGVPLLPLKRLRMFKPDTANEKDLRDIELIDSFLKQGNV